MDTFVLHMWIEVGARVSKHGLNRTMEIEEHDKMATDLAIQMF